MKPSHLYYKDVNRKDGAYYRRWASAYGGSTAELIDTVLRSARHEEQAFNSCAGILHMCKDIPHGLVEEASRKCVQITLKWDVRSAEAERLFHSDRYEVPLLLRVNQFPSYLCRSSPGDRYDAYR